VNYCLSPNINDLEVLVVVQMPWESVSYTYLECGFYRLLRTVIRYIDLWPIENRVRCVDRIRDCTAASPLPTTEDRTLQEPLSVLRHTTAEEMASTLKKSSVLPTGSGSDMVGERGRRRHRAGSCRNVQCVIQAGEVVQSDTRK